MNENIVENKSESKMNSDLEFILLNDYQKKFPMTERPFQTIAFELNTNEETVINAYRKLLADGKISRVGPIFAPGVFGFSTLAAMKIPEEKIEQIANIVSSFPEVNHNYLRSHEINLWFVVMACDLEKLNSVIEKIEIMTGFPVYPFPLEQEYKIDLGFSMRSST